MLNLIPYYKPTDISSREDVDLVCPIRQCVPIVAANMDTVGTLETYEILKGYKILTALSKYVDHKRFDSYMPYAIYTTGLYDDIHISSKSQFDYICIDVSNGYIKAFYDRVEYLRKEYPNTKLIAGNVCTREAVIRLFSLGVDIVKYGIGNGACCTTYLKTGVGFGQTKLIEEVFGLLKNKKYSIMYDGGVKNPGEAACLLALGFSHVMLGTYFAGHDDMGVPHFYYDHDMSKSHKKYKIYGMASKEAHDRYHKKCSRKQRAYEGKSLVLDSKGSLHDTVNDLLGSLASACTFTSSPNILDLQNAEVIWK